MSVTVREPAHVASEQISEGRHLRVAGWLGIFPLVGTTVMLGLGRYPYPNDNVDPRQYVTYMLGHHHLAEIQTILWVLAIAAMLVFVAVLAAAYIRRAGRVTASGLIMIAGTAVYAAASIASIGVYMAVVLWMRGFPSFGANPADARLVAFGWDILNMGYFVCQGIVALIWVAIAVANRSHPILPRALGSWGSGLVVAINLGTLGCLFVDSGTWSPGSAAQFSLQAAGTFGWIAVAAVTLLRSTHAR